MILGQRNDMFNERSKANNQVVWTTNNKLVDDNTLLNEQKVCYMS